MGSETTRHFQGLDLFGLRRRRRRLIIISRPSAVVDAAPVLLTLRRTRLSIFCGERWGMRWVRPSPVYKTF